MARGKETALLGPTRTVYRKVEENTEARSLFKILVSTNKTAWRHNAEYYNLNVHSCENLNS
jgi:hypothetical protein